MLPLFVTGYTVVCASGHGRTALISALLNHQGGLHQNDFGPVKLQTYIGEVMGIDAVDLPTSLISYDCRNNRLAEMAILQDNFIGQVEDLKQRVESQRIGLFLGTSTSGTLSSEEAYRTQQTTSYFPNEYQYKKTHDLYSLTEYIKKRLDIRGPSFTVSTACSSSAKVFCEAARFIDTGFCDAVIVGGVDTLCYNTLFGFNSLQLISKDKCRPFDTNRSGISIGEAGGFMILEKAPHNSSRVMLEGFGESSDAHHISTPHPEGTGAIKAINEALQRAQLSNSDIAYVNLHGTATLSNDISEAAAVSSIFTKDTICSSTKGWTGHTLGAAGIVEAVISCIGLEEQFIPGTLNSKDLDETLDINLALKLQQKNYSHTLSNSFGFGGTNCSLIFGRI
ncbi:MAG: beta-ketoacyl-[acyl-carrier-protein] synthase family protein [Candidatus Thiodiazotropha sp. (ex Lucinoma borealis)]|nr:beta-ketoacyl-[acyl-carrier-protein] synthase family protein [Candidatus Thiodiazotropha sp. (ex Lucinoma borealis)]MCU7867400.1 beta-ketoacyl-[acyl-carrier-protein] synthase family protein [Candidatus Thiodiazotropha sp. (ex Lucinoma borealis)]